MTQRLRRELGVFGATMMGLGSIIGTGIFVSVGIGAGAAGPAVILAIALAAVVATCNGLNSAQLAANHPVSGGTYEYGYHYLSPRLGFTAGWLFLLAKSASAATAALGFSGYLLNALSMSESSLLVPLALAVVIIMTVIVLSGIRRSNLTNTVIVSLTLLVLGIFVITGLPAITTDNFSPFLPDEAGISGLLQSTALMFVAYTGYGRIATMGEEVTEPRRTIPRAIITTLIATMLLYVAVALVGIGAIGAESLAGARPPRWKWPHAVSASPPCRRSSRWVRLPPCWGCCSTSFWGCRGCCWRWVAAAICPPSPPASTNPARLPPSR